jgi:superfamily II DNA helicase RecQ
MQIKLFTIPILGGEQINEEMNRFLRSRKVLQTESHLVTNSEGSFWCFCIKYLSGAVVSPGKKKKIDYREVLDKESFKRFARMREIRKRLAKEEGVPAFAIFTDAEMAELAKIEILTPAAMRKVKGVGEQKIEKFGKYFISQAQDEKSQPPA